MESFADRIFCSLSGRCHWSIDFQQHFRGRVYSWPGFIQDLLGYISYSNPSGCGILLLLLFSRSVCGSNGALQAFDLVWTTARLCLFACVAGSQKASCCSCKQNLIAFAPYASNNKEDVIKHLGHRQIWETKGRPGVWAYLCRHRYCSHCGIREASFLCFRWTICRPQLQQLTRASVATKCCEPRISSSSHSCHLELI